MEFWNKKSTNITFYAKFRGSKHYNFQKFFLIIPIVFERLYYIEERKKEEREHEKSKNSDHKQ